MKKNAQSEVISTILLILLVIASIAVIMGFVIPLVKDQLKKNECFDYSGKIEIINNEKYTCYNMSAKNLSIQIHFGDIDEESTNPIKGIKMIVNSEGKSENFEIIPPNSNPNERVYMYSGGILEIPKKNSERAYNIININSRPNSTAVYFILNDGRECSDAAYTADYISLCK